ncbi:MAG: hypothetical protein KTR31_31580 [Myxococcales bacterium]|nr:hypothetical protein [Myxococcales bacterium]
MSALQAQLQPEVDALVHRSRMEVVDQVRAQATQLATQRVDGDVEAVVEATLDEIFGLGPLEPLLRDPAHHTIVIEGAQVFVQDGPVAWTFRDEAHARSVVGRILAAVGMELDDALDGSAAGVTATMLDGSTVAVRLDGAVMRAEITRP